MDYLKSVVVEYLAKPPGSSERSALLPVLATLLQFEPEDYVAIEQGKNKVSWFGEILPTIISGPEAPKPSTLPPQQAAPLLSASPAPVASIRAQKAAPPSPPKSAEVNVKPPPPRKNNTRTKGTSMTF